MEAERNSVVERFPLVAGDSAVVPALTSVVRRLAVARSIQEVMEIVVHPARSLLRAGGVTFVLRDGDLCYYAEEDAISPLWKGKRFPMEACISGWCMLEARAVGIPNIYRDERIPHDAYKPTFVQSMAIVPVPQDRPIAAMGVYWPEVQDVPQEALDLLQTLGNAAALAIMAVDHRQERARLDGHRRELGHRLKNVFALVEGLVRQTQSPDVDTYRTALLHRLMTLETVHAELADSAEETADLGDLLRAVLLPLAGSGSGNLQLDGPRVMLPAGVATDFAFIVCELGTNAVKHGALSTPTGKVAIRWEREDETLRMQWEESGGPPVSPPTETGFGTKYIEHAVTRSLRGIYECSYQSGNLLCELRVPVPDHERHR
jgi:two-component sensor histidine kinase